MPALRFIWKKPRRTLASAPTVIVLGLVALHCLSGSLGMWVACAHLKEREGQCALPGIFWMGELHLPEGHLYFLLGFGLLVLSYVLLLRLSVHHLGSLLHPVLRVVRLYGARDSIQMPEPSLPVVHQLVMAAQRLNLQPRQSTAQVVALIAATLHDLQAPITRLRLRADLVNDEVLRNMLVTDLDTVTAMLQDQLEYARSEHLCDTFSPVDLMALVDSMAEDWLDIGHTVTVTGALAHPYAVDLRAIKRVMCNLVGNAIKYGDSAHIHLSETSKGAAICVTDPGPGVPEEMLAKVFEPFVRLNRCGPSSGTGLGLTIARNLVHAHGGDIQLRNRPEGGLAAMFTLPVSLRQTPARAAPMQEGTPTVSMCRASRESMSPSESAPAISDVDGSLSTCSRSQGANFTLKKATACATVS